MSTHLHVFGSLGTNIYTSPNADYLPEPPIVTDSISSIFDGLRTRFAYDLYFYFAFVPLQPHYDGPVLGCLSPFAVEVEQVAGRAPSLSYQLKPARQRQWQALEQLMLRLQRCLLRRISSTYLETATTPDPSSFGYAAAWPTAARAILATRLARAAFTLRFAFLSYLLMKEEVAGTHVWEDISQDEHAIPLTMCNVLRTSWICDWSIPRIGAFVDITRTFDPNAQCQWHRDIPHIVSLGNSIPLWFAYPSNPISTELSPATRALYQQLRPENGWAWIVQDAAMVLYTSDSEFHGSSLRTNDYYGHLVVNTTTRTTDSRVTVRRRTGDAVLYSHAPADGSTSLTRLQEYTPSHSTLQSYAFLYRGRQLPGELYKEFVSREEDIQTKWALAESEEDRRKRLARIASQQSQPLPGRNGPSVYIWTHEQDAEIRRKVLFRDVRYVWRHTTAEQRLYNSFRHEYDINYLSAYILDDGNAAQDTAETGLHDTGAYLMPNHPDISSPLPSPSRAPVSLSSSQVDPSQLDVTVHSAQSTTHLPKVSTTTRNLEELEFLRLQSHSNTYPKVPFTTPDNMHTPKVHYLPCR
ncbi:hypothetical protein BC835DRAFT_1421459 [Cytidiella melzeri]|nr:hypothetical protein BC835DRAFT_1421459 [Cytidiella melzeri]